MPTAVQPATRGLRSRNDVEMAALLDRRYGDRLVYVMGDGDRALLCLAIARGLVDKAGYLTPCGYRLVHRQP